MVRAVDDSGLLPTAREISDAIQEDVGNLDKSTISAITSKVAQFNYVKAVKDVVGKSDKAKSVLKKYDEVKKTAESALTEKSKNVQ